MTTPSFRWLPWTRSCFVCGENNPHGLHRRSRLQDGRVILEHQAREADLGYRNLVHGGIAGTLLDEVMTWAAIVALRRPCVAAELSFRLKQPIVVGTRMRVEAWIAENRRRLLLTAGWIRDDDDRILVTATGKYVPMPDGGVHLCQKDFVTAPEAIPPEELFGPATGAAPLEH